MVFSLLIFYLSGIFIPIDSWANEGIAELRVRGEVPVEFINDMPYDRESVIKKLAIILSKSETNSKRLLAKRILEFYRVPDSIFELYGGVKSISDTVNRYFPKLGINTKLPDFDASFEIKAKFGNSDEYPIKTWHWPDGDTIVGIDFVRAHIVAKFGNANVMLGRESIKWGPGPFPSLLISGCAPPYDLIMCTYKYGIIKGSFFFAPLDQYVSNDTIINRYQSAHRLSISLFQNNLIIGFSEAMIFARNDIFSGICYLNPVSFYRLCEYNYHYAREARGLVSFNDNLFWDFDFAWYFRKNNLYGEFLIDDVGTPTDPDNPFFRDIKSGPVGWTLGFKTVDFFLPKSYWIFQYTRVNAYTYFHALKQNYYLYWGYPLGHPRGSDFDELSCKLTYHMNINWDFNIMFNFMRHGETILAEDAPKPPRNDFLRGTVQKSFDLKLGFTFFRLPWAVSYGHLGYSWIKNYRHKRGEDTTFPSISLNLEITNILY